MKGSKSDLPAVDRAVSPVTNLSQGFPPAPADILTTFFTNGNGVSS
uniref:Uncharacterized protein n=1 Tax=Aegilops tauschii subsp. strangulata TaxID=200361 RepID=A0A453GZJ0_AEGTS